MAIPADPTITSIVTEGLKRGGRVNPTSSQITDATEHQFREVKSDIGQRSARHSSLETQAVTTIGDGDSRHSWPTDADDIRSIVLASAPTEEHWQSIAQGGASQSLTLHASFSQDPTIVRGRFLFLTGGAAINQFGQIVSYNDGTKVAGVDRPWVTTPGVGTAYLIGTAFRKLYAFDKPWGWDVLSAPYSRGTPCKASPVGREIWLDYAPDATYALWWDYWANLDRIDEAGAVFIRHLRDHRSLWVQGVAVKTMQRYDEDRYQLELGVYNDMLQAYAGLSAGVGQVIFTDV